MTCVFVELIDLFKADLDTGCGDIEQLNLFEKYFDKSFQGNFGGSFIGLEFNLRFVFDQFQEK